MIYQPSAPQIEYPETDGQPMTESDATRSYLIYCVAALRLFFQSRPRVYASGNLFIYYEEGNNKKSLSPDVFVIFGVSKRERRSYQSWREGNKLPAFVLELTSKTTKQQDEVTKPALYAQLGVQEYFQYDPTGDYLNPQLKGQTLVEGQYQPLLGESAPDGSWFIRSQVLGLDLCLLPPARTTSLGPEEPLGPVRRELRLVDPKTGSQLPTYEEAEQARMDAEQARMDAEQARMDAEQARMDAEQARLNAEQVAAQERDRAQAAEQQLAALQAQLRQQGIELDG
jgi:Uma2 family endonuclease